jgi:transcriptional regulator with XRE-family HTH domain
MGRRPGEQTKIETRLAQWRVKRGATQASLAGAVGLSLATYRRLERGQNPNPPLGYLVNCAIALGCELDDLLDDHYRDWYVLDPWKAGKPPQRERLWGRGSTSG